MTDTTDAIAAVNALKTAHITAILSAAASLHALILSEPELYLGGLPAPMVKLADYLSYQSAVLSSGMTSPEEPGEG